MNLQVLAHIGEFVGGIGVILSLVYVALQVRGNTRSQRNDIEARVLERLASLQRELASNEDLFVKLLADLVSNYGDAAQNIRSQLAAGDREAAAGAAHKIRGIANNLGATDIGKSAETIEETLRAGELATDDQLQSLAEAITVVASSHAELANRSQPDSTTSGVEDIDIALVFKSLQEAVSTSDPGALDLIEQLLSAQAPGSIAAEQLASARDLLDSFNFGDAAPLLDSIAQELGVQE